MVIIMTVAHIFFPIWGLKIGFLGCVAWRVGKDSDLLDNIAICESVAVASGYAGYKIADMIVYIVDSFEGKEDTGRDLPGNLNNEDSHLEL